MKRLLAALILLTMVLLEASLLPLFPFKGVSPLLTLPVIIALAFQGKETPALWGAFLGGILVDLFSISHFGLSPLCFLVFALGALSVRRFSSSLFFVVLPSTFLSAALYRFLIIGRLDSSLIFVGVLGLGTMLVVYFVVQRLGAMLFGEEELQLDFRKRL